MSEWPAIWLGVIAIAVAVMAIVQVAAALAALKMAKQSAVALEELRREIKPLVEKAHKVSDEAARVAALAATQMERVDRLLSSTADRIDETITVVQSALIEPARHGAAALAAMRAALAAVRGWRDRGGHGRDEEEALFVG